MLTPAPLNRIEAFILHPYRERLGQELFQDAVRETLERLYPQADIGLMAHCVETEAHFVCGDDRVYVNQSGDPLSLDQLEPLLRHQSVRSAFPDAEERIFDHQCVTSISFRKGMIEPEAIPAPSSTAPLFNEICTQLINFQTSEEVLSALETVAALVETLSLLMPGSAIIFPFNQSMMTVDHFQMLNTPETLELLAIRPDVYTGEKTAGGKQVAGLTLTGSEFLTGRRIVFEPSAAPIDFMMARALGFIKTCILREAFFPDGDLFGTSQQEQIRVRFVAPQNTRDVPLAVLTIENSPEHGIFCEQKPTIHTHYDADGVIINQDITGVDKETLDPSDPIDAAILRRLEEVSAERRESPKQAQSSQESHPEVSKSAEASSSAPHLQPKVIRARSTSATTGNSVSDLRKFAHENMSKETFNTGRDETGSFLQKFGFPFARSKSRSKLN